MLSMSEAMAVDGLKRLAAGDNTRKMLRLALELDVFAKLKGKSVPLEEVASLWGLPTTTGRMVAQYLTNFGLLQYDDGQLANRPIAEAHLVEQTPLRTWVSHVVEQEIPYEEWKERLLQPTDQLWYQIRDEGDITDPRTLHSLKSEEWWEWFFKEAHQRRVRWGEEFAEIYDFSFHSCVLDVGGASGGWCIGIRRLFPHIQGILFDIPRACQVAREKIEEAGETDSIKIIEGSFFTDELPQGADVILLANVLHDWSPAEGLALLQKAYRALPEDGVVLLWEFYFEDDWSGPFDAVNQAYNVLGAEGKSGWQPSYSEMEALLYQAGFQECERRPNCLVAHKSVV